MVSSIHPKTWSGIIKNHWKYRMDESRQMQKRQGSLSFLMESDVGAARHATEQYLEQLLFPTQYLP